jgi:hypothetical protein
MSISRKTGIKSLVGIVIWSWNKTVTATKKKLYSWPVHFLVEKIFKGDNESDFSDFHFFQTNENVTVCGY